MQKFIQNDALEFAPGKVSKIDLAEGEVNSALYLLFDYLLSNNGGSAPGTRRGFARIAGMVREIKITLNDTDDILRLSGFEAMAIYLGDHGRLPSTMQIVAAGVQTTSILPINHWRTNSDAMALTMHDYRKARKVTLSITWGTLGDIFGNVNDGTIDMSLRVEQQAIDTYVSPYNGKITKAGKQARYNPAVRYFFRNVKKFTKNEAGVELGRIEKGHTALCQGFYLFATADNDIHSTAFSGTLRLRQGTETLTTVSIETLLASQETLKGIEISRDVIYVPFSGLFRSSELERMRRWKDDLIIEGDFSFAASDDGDNYVTVLADAFRQERLK